MNQYIERFNTGETGQRVQIEYLHPDRVYEKVLDGSAISGLVSFPRVARARGHSWRDEEMVLTCAPATAGPATHGQALPAWAREPFVGFRPRLTIRRQIDRSSGPRHRPRRRPGVRQHRDHQARRGGLRVTSSRCPRCSARSRRRRWPPCASPTRAWCGRSPSSTAQRTLSPPCGARDLLAQAGRSRPRGHCLLAPQKGMASR